MSNTQTPVTTRSINNILPLEIFRIIFEEHAKLEWRAPTIDGRVCGLWRQIVLNTPRAWAYLEIDENDRPSIVEVCSWLHRSGNALLHIRVSDDFTFGNHVPTTTLYGLLCEYHTRIASLRVHTAKPPFFEGRDFPSMRQLDIRSWSKSVPPPAQWGHMPQLKTLRLRHANFGFTALDHHVKKSLGIDGSICALILQHSPSLTTLMLDNLSLEGLILAPVSFPSLTYLSLSNVAGLKLHIDAPRLVTYHEGGIAMTESFPTSIQSIAEYGAYHLGTIVPVLTNWLHAFTNVSRLSIRAHAAFLIRFFGSLSSYPHLLPALRTISVKGVFDDLSEAVEELIFHYVQCRSEACQMDIALQFEKIADADYNFLWKCE